MAKPTNFSYEGKDLETMSAAHNYYQWILSFFGPYLGKKIVEVGAGSGTFSAMLAAIKPKSLTLVEPSKEMYPLLQKNAKKISKKVSVDTYNDFLGNIKTKVKKKDQPDSVIYINVMEHVEDDRQELKIMYDLLPKGGRIFIFVPAMQGLMSDFDRTIGHFRRYSKGELEQKAQDAGFKVLTVRYFDILGIAPWWLKFTIGKSTVMQPGLAKTYDKFIVPIMSRLERLLPPVIGKNVLLVAEKK